jgi:hypothetical protein
MHMFLVELGVTLTGSRRLTDEEITNLIERVVDELDQASIDPSLSTSRRGDDVDLTVGVTIDQAGELDALARALEFVRAAFRTAGIGNADSVVPCDLRSRVMTLQAA